MLHISLIFDFSQILRNFAKFRKISREKLLAQAAVNDEVFAVVDDEVIAAVYDEVFAVVVVDDVVFAAVDDQVDAIAPLLMDSAALLAGCCSLVL